VSRPRCVIVNAYVGYVEEITSIACSSARKNLLNGGVALESYLVLAKGRCESTGLLSLGRAYHDFLGLVAANKSLKGRFYDGQPRLKRGQKNFLDKSVTKSDYLALG
jgi:hypothetical protein